jgi:voltage-gated potassium channel
MLGLRAIAQSPGYQFFMLVLCLFALGIMGFQASEPQQTTLVVLDYADLAVCMVFLVDFVINLVRAENRWKYFVTWGWVDLLSSIPAVDVARWGRFARILRIFRLLRGIRATHVLVSLVMKHRAQNAIMAAALMALMLVTFCSIGILHFEAATGNIKTAEDAVWWSFVTIATVGYGDKFPVTTEGRMIAVLLMSGGVALFGVFSGFLASWFVGEEDATTKEVAALRAEIARLSERLDKKPI